MMQRILNLIVLTIFPLLLIAQEEVPEEVDDRTFFTDEMKVYWLFAIAALSIFFVVRTFRNKPEA